MLEDPRSVSDRHDSFVDVSGSRIVVVKAG